MKLKEWKAFLDTIPDSEYTRELDYTQFEESDTVDVEDYDSLECYVLLGRTQIPVQYANANRGFAIAIKGCNTGEDMIADENGDIETEFIFGDIKIIKYKSKP